MYDWIYDRFGSIGLLTATLSFGFCFYFVFVRLSYSYYFIQNRNRYVPDYQENPEELRDAKLWSARNIIGNTLFVFPIQLLIVFGYSKLYYGLGEHGWVYLIASTVGAILFAETSIYWLHRALHVRPLYGWLHAVHHRFREPTSWVSYAFNPLDSFIQSLPYHVYIFLIPTNAWIYMSLWIFSSFWTLTIHDRVRWTPDFLGSIVNHTGCHTAHHWFHRHNYGNYFTFWDRICGTYFDPDRLPHKFFAVKSGATRRDSAERQQPAQL